MSKLTELLEQHDEETRLVVLQELLSSVEDTIKRQGERIGTLGFSPVCENAYRQGMDDIRIAVQTLLDRQESNVDNHTNKETAPW